MIAVDIARWKNGASHLPTSAREGVGELVTEQIEITLQWMSVA